MQLHLRQKYKFVKAMIDSLMMMVQNSSFRLRMSQSQSYTVNVYAATDSYERKSLKIVFTICFSPSNVRESSLITELEYHLGRISIPFNEYSCFKILKMSISDTHF